MTPPSPYDGDTSPSWNPRRGGSSGQQKPDRGDDQDGADGQQDRAHAPRWGIAVSRCVPRVDAIVANVERAAEGPVGPRIVVIALDEVLRAVGRLEAHDGMIAVAVINASVGQVLLVPRIAPVGQRAGDLPPAQDEPQRRP